MKADDLNIWEAEDLAKILAERYLDAEDLMEALPEAAQVGKLEVQMLPLFIDMYWRSILQLYDAWDLNEWLEECKCLQEWEEWEQDYKLEEYIQAAEEEEEFFSEILFLRECFRYCDQTVHYCPPKKTAS